jgi:hypothetical protein
MSGLNSAVGHAKRMSGGSRHSAQFKIRTQPLRNFCSAGATAPDRTDLIV